MQRVLQNGWPGELTFTMLAAGAWHLEAGAAGAAARRGAAGLVWGISRTEFLSCAMDWVGRQRFTPKIGKGIFYGLH
jgi:hypothetical protein